MKLPQGAASAPVFAVHRRSNTLNLMTLCLITDLLKFVVKQHRILKGYQLHIRAAARTGRLYQVVMLDLSSHLPYWEPIAEWPHTKLVPSLFPFI